MALTERSRSALYLGLSSIVDEEAVQEMMSFFPARDVEEPVTKELLRAEMSDLRSELKGEMADLRAEMAGLRTEMSAMESRIIRWNVATMFVFAGAIIGLIRL